MENLKYFFFVITLFLSISLVSADTITINYGGDTNLCITSGGIIGRCFFGQLDITPPFIEILQPENDSTHFFPSSINVTFVINATDDMGISAYWYSINGESNITFFTATIGIQFIQPHLTTREYIVRVYANDTSNNINSTTVTITIVQTTPAGGVITPTPPAPNETIELPEELPEDISICNLKSLENIGTCLTSLGSKLWPASPHVGIFLLLISFYIILLILVYNKQRILIVQDTKKYVGIILGVMIFIMGLIIFVWVFEGCQVDRLGDVASCIYGFGGKLWPGHSIAGVGILTVLLGMISILFLFNRNKKKKKIIEKEES